MPPRRLGLEVGLGRHGKLELYTELGPTRSRLKNIHLRTHVRARTQLQGCWARVFDRQELVALCQVFASTLRRPCTAVVTATLTEHH